MYASKNKAKLESSQSKCLRMIFKIKYNKNNIISNTELAKKANLETIEERSKKLLNEYIFKCISTQNELIKPLIENYFNMRSTLPEAAKQTLIGLSGIF